MRGRDGWEYVCRPVTCLHHRFASKGVLPLIQEHGSVFHWGAQIHLVLRSHRAHRWREHKELASEHKSETNPLPSCINIHEMRSFFSFFHCCFLFNAFSLPQGFSFWFFPRPPPMRRHGCGGYDVSRLILSSPDLPCIRYSQPSGLPAAAFARMHPLDTVCTT